MPSTSSDGHRGLAEDLAEPLVDLRDHRGRVGPRRRQRVVRGGQWPHRQVEHLDPGAGLADVDADHVRVAGVDPQQRAGPAAVGVDQPGLHDQALLDELADDVAHRALAQPAGPTEVLPALRLAQVEAGEQDGPVVPPQVADVRLTCTSLPPSACVGTGLDATMPRPVRY
jgi:hypothetical protein